MWSIEGNEFRKQTARCSRLGNWWRGLRHCHVGLDALVLQNDDAWAVAFPPEHTLGHGAGYLCTVGSRSPGCVRGSGRGEAGTPLFHTVPARCGRCTEYRSQCSTFLLPQSTLLQGRGKWRGCWALASAPRSHLGKDTESKGKKSFISSHTNSWRTWYCVLQGTEKRNWLTSVSLCSY